MKKRVIPEAAIEHQILCYLRKQGIFAWKQPQAGYFDVKLGRFRKQQSPFAINGVSDILGVLPSGRLLAIECKSATGKVSPDQERFIGQINANGGLAFVARCVEDAQDKLKYLTDPKP